MGLLELGFEVVAEGHELIDLGDDALLLGKWGKRTDKASDLLQVDVWLGSTSTSR